MSRIPRRIKITPAVLLFGLAVLLLPLITAACSGGSSSLGLTFRGPILAITMVNIFTIPELAYTEEDGSPTLIVPTSNDNELVVIHVRVQNHAAEEALLDIDAQPAELRTAGDQRFKAINTTQVGIPTDQQRLDENLETLLKRGIQFPQGLFIRGVQELKKGFELDGWLVFDVPKGSKLDQLRWEAGGDIIFVDL